MIEIKKYKKEIKRLKNLAFPKKLEVNSKIKEIRKIKTFNIFYFCLEGIAFYDKDLELKALWDLNLKNGKIKTFEYKSFFQWIEDVHSNFMLPRVWNGRILFQRQSTIKEYIEQMQKGKKSAYLPVLTDDVLKEILKKVKK